MNKLNILFEGSQGVLFSVSPEQLPELLNFVQFVKKEYNYVTHKYDLHVVGSKDTTITIIKDEDMPVTPIPTAFVEP